MWNIFEKKVAIDKYEMWLLGLEARPDLKTFLARGLGFVFCFFNIVLGLALIADRFIGNFYNFPDWGQGLIALFTVSFCVLFSAILSRFLNIWAHKKSK